MKSREARNLESVVWRGVKARYSDAERRRMTALRKAGAAEAELWLIHCLKGELGGRFV